MEIVERVSMRDVMLSGQPTIYYSTGTCWWTHNPSHLKLTPPPTEENILQYAETLRLNSKDKEAPVEDFLERAREVMRHRLPCDPRGAMLMQADLPGFLAAVRKSVDQYGKHELRAFMAGHHSNSQKSVTDPSPWAETGWDAYNEALDRLDERKQAGHTGSEAGKASPDIAEAAATTFVGEMMRCIICKKEEESDPTVESNWRCIQLGQKKYYACPDEFPADGAAVDEFKTAYMKVIVKIAKLKGMRPEKLARQIKVD